MNSNLTVWFDGSCPLCKKEMGLMRGLDRQKSIDFVDVPGEASISCPVDKTLLLQRFHAREAGELLSGAAAFAAMWRAIPLLRPFGLIARNRLILSALERLYLAFLLFRPRLQRWVA